METSQEISWPDFNHPDNCAIHVRNKLDMNAKPSSVWDCLVDATHWPEWYKHASEVVMQEEAQKILQLGSKFRWKTMGAGITSTVLEFVPHERLAWNGRAFGLDVYHAWLLVPSERGCLVITEETQRGLTAQLGKFFLNRKMQNAHQLWLECLESRARRSTPA